MRSAIIQVVASGSFVIEPVKTHKSTIPDAGSGLFSNCVFEPGNIIGEYDGYLKKREDLELSEIATSISLREDEVLVGTGNLAMANDIVLVESLSRRIAEEILLNRRNFREHPGLARNAKFSRRHQKGAWSVELVATRTIGVGEEIFVSYGKGFWVFYFALYGLIPPEFGIQGAITKMFSRS